MTSIISLSESCHPADSWPPNPNPQTLNPTSIFGVHPVGLRRNWGFGLGQEVGLKDYLGLGAKVVGISKEWCVLSSVVGPLLLPAA